MNASGGGNPVYNWSWPPVAILSHQGDDEPWVIDPYVTYDPNTRKLWLSWGGGTIWVTELDPTKGTLLGNPKQKEFDQHHNYHTPVAYWDGDKISSDWVEGSALVQNGEFWYLFGSYGDLDANYTIRVGRAISPTGPFVDKKGIALVERDTNGIFGSTIILGTEGGQANPGHPHIWEEDGLYYLGYDYQDAYDLSFVDRFGIRQLYRIKNWPIIAYKPITVTFTIGMTESYIGELMTVFFRNVGSHNSVLAVDVTSLSIDY